MSLRLLVSLSAMSPRSAANRGISAGASPALPTGGEGLPRTPAEQLARLGPQRVCALGRATRSANGSACRSAGAVESSARHSPHARRRLSENWLQFIVGGPRLLTEDRQKPRRLAEGMHGTRNTVPSIAFNAASFAAARCRRQRRPRIEDRVRRVRPELPEFAEGTAPVL